MSNLRLSDYFNACQESLLNNCIECGNCVDSCLVMKYIPDAPASAEIMRGIKEFLKGGELSPEAYLKTAACMGCYGCVDSNCPIGLDSLCINQLVSRSAELRKEVPFSLPLYKEQQLRLSEIENPDELARITTPVYTKGAKYAYFPGCNIYMQPDKVLNSLDILDAVGVPYSFIPGIQYCCGLPRGGLGDADWLQDSAEKLIAKAVEYGAETLILWCPTCLCNMKYRVEKFVEELPFETISFGKYISMNLEKLSFPNAKPCTITLHEPCKTAYMDIDMEDVRNVLSAIPGTTLIEMEHNRNDTNCCGCRAIKTMPEVGGVLTENRFDEALATGADKMLDICHACHMFFLEHQKKTGRNDIEVENYSTYINYALGNKREDWLK